MNPKNNASAMLFLVTFIGLCLSATGSWFFYQVEEKAIIVQLKQDIDERADSFVRAISTDLETLYALAILFRTDTPPSALVFSQEASRIIQRHPNIQALV